jgi:thymidylate kinase
MLIFMDGPNGAGKDYLIGKMRNLFAKKRKKFDTISFKDVIQDAALKNTVYSRKEEEIGDKGAMDIYNTHFVYIDKIKELESKNDLVVVNRYVPSYYVYQYMLPEVANPSVTLDLVVELTKEYIDAFKFYDQISVHLREDSDVLIERILKRDKTADVEKHRKLQKYYEMYNDTIATMFSHLLIAKSEEVEKLLAEVEYA